MCHSKEKLWELPPGPRVVLASVPSLVAGMSLQLLVDWAPNPNNLIVFPGTAPVRPLCLPPHRLTLPLSSCARPGLSTPGGR